MHLFLCFIFNLFIFCIFAFGNLRLWAERTTLWNLAFAIYSKTFRKLGGGKNYMRIKSGRLRYAWAFGLSCVVGFRQVPLNVDESIRPRFACIGVLAEVSFAE